MLKWKDPESGDLLGGDTIDMASVEKTMSDSQRDTVEAWLADVRRLPAPPIELDKCDFSDIGADWDAPTSSDGPSFVLEISASSPPPKAGTAASAPATAAARSAGATA